jgi:hypothetical protein
VAVGHGCVRKDMLPNVADEALEEVARTVAAAMDAAG